MRNDFSWSGGFCLGAAAQLLKFRFLDIAVIQRIAVEKRDPAGVQLKAAFVTLLLFGGAAAAVLKLGFNVWAMALGVFLPRLILIADTYLRPNPFADEEVERQDSPVTEGSDTARPESAPTQPTPGQSAERHGDA